MATATFREQVERVKREALTVALADAGGCASVAARALALPRTYFLCLCRQRGLVPWCVEHAESRTARLRARPRRGRAT